MLLKHLSSHEFEFFVYAILLTAFAFIRQNEGSRLKLFLRSFANLNLVEQQIRLERSFSRFAVFIYIFTIFSISAFIVHTLNYLGFFIGFSYGGLISIVIIAIVLLTTGRLAIYSLLAWLFNLEELQQKHAFYWLLYSFLNALPIVFLSIFYSYGPQELRLCVIIFGWALIVCAYLLRIARLTFLALAKYRVPVLYNFLYFCALEFMPLALVLTVIWRQVG